MEGSICNNESRMAQECSACKLSTLPAETLSNIAGHLERPAYLNLSKTCKGLYVILYLELYRNLTLVIPRAWSSVMCLEQLLKLSACCLQNTYGLQFTQKLTILSPNADVSGDHSPEQRANERDDDDEGLYLGNFEDSVGNNKEKEFQPRVLNILMRLIIQRIPQNQLRSFVWQHTTQLSWMTVTLLAQTHGDSLKDLRMWNLNEGFLDMKYFSNLEILHIGDIDPAFEFRWPAYAMTNNSHSLTHLTLGRETDLAEVLSEEEEVSAFTPKFDRTIRQVPNICRMKSTHSQSSILHLISLHLIGFDFNYLCTQKRPFLLDIDCLTSLKLESCSCIEGISHLVSLNKEVSSKPRLKLRTLAIRSEESDAGFLTKLEVLLSSFSGLEDLSVLLEGSGPFLSPKVFIPNHGSTLQTLLWEQRTWPPRNSIGLATSTGEEADGLAMPCDISRGCPNLRELGLALNVAPDINFQAFYKNVGSLAGLMHLKTLNIRNMPDFNNTTFTRASATHEYEYLVNTVVKTFLNGYKGESEHPLHTIAFGRV